MVLEQCLVEELCTCTWKTGKLIIYNSFGGYYDTKTMILIVKENEIVEFKYFNTNQILPGNHE